MIPAFLDAALAGRARCRCTATGVQTRDFTYVGTVCSVLADAVRRRVTADRPVNLAFGTRVSLLEVIDLIERQLGHRLERAHGDPRAGDVRDSQADQSALRRLFPDVRPVPLDEGLRATIAWFEEPVSDTGTQPVPVTTATDRPDDTMPTDVVPGAPGPSGGTRPGARWGPGRRWPAASWWGWSSWAVCGSGPTRRRPSSTAGGSRSIHPAVRNTDWRRISDLRSTSVLVAGSILAAVVVVARDRWRALACLVAPAAAVLLTEWVLKPDDRPPLRRGPQLPVGHDDHGGGGGHGVRARRPPPVRGRWSSSSAPSSWGWSAWPSIALQWHYPTDALAGVVFGAGFVLLVDGRAPPGRRGRAAPVPGRHRGAAPTAPATSRGSGRRLTPGQRRRTRRPWCRRHPTGRMAWSARRGCGPGSACRRPGYPGDRLPGDGMPGARSGTGLGRWGTELGGTTCRLIGTVRA